MSEISSYPKIYALGHWAIGGIFNTEVSVTEKIDGSQFSFGIIGGELLARSRGQRLILDTPNKMFEQAVETAKELAPILTDGWIYRCEYLQKPKHNTLSYDRTPRGYLMVFDIERAPQDFLTDDERYEESQRIGLESVPVFYRGVVKNQEMIKEMLSTVSILGGQLIEGVVVKNYALFLPDGKVAMGKYVSEAFKEVHRKSWRERNPTSGDVLYQLSNIYCNPARWEKAAIHLREADLLEESPKDIGNLILEVQRDIEQENADEIKQFLFNHYWPKLRRSITAGLPEWWKNKLLEKAFEEVTNQGELE